MYYLFLFVQFNLIACLNIKHTVPEINQLKTNRPIRCLTLPLSETLLTKSLDIKREKCEFNNLLQIVNANDSVCSNSDGQCVKENVSHNLLVNTFPEIHWHDYKAAHNKLYPSPYQEMAAFKKWRLNLKRITKHNKEYLEGKQSYSLQLNHLGDMSLADYFKNLLKHINTIPLFDPFEDHHRTALRNITKCKTPKRVDWRKKGFTPRLEEQMKCGACYAFAVTHALQAQLYKRHKIWKELSPQQIIDCSVVDGNMGCAGGSLRGALRYVAREGLSLESNYPYVAKKEACKYNKSVVGAKPTRWSMLPVGDERAIERAVASIGPLPVGLNSAPFTFQFYRSGIYDDPFCTPWQLNHAMLLVGYTPEYWILLNWWGRNWGEDGYIRIRRGLNICGVANMAAYVEIEH